MRVVTQVRDHHSHGGQSAILTIGRQRRLGHIIRKALLMLSHDGCEIDPRIVLHRVLPHVRSTAVRTHALGVCLGCPTYSNGPAKHARRVDVM